MVDYPLGVCESMKINYIFYLKEKDYPTKRKF